MMVEISSVLKKTFITKKDQRNPLRNGNYGRKTKPSRENKKDNERDKVKQKTRTMNRHGLRETISQYIPVRSQHPSDTCSSDITTLLLADLTYFVIILKYHQYFFLITSAQTVVSGRRI